MKRYSRFLGSLCGSGLMAIGCQGQPANGPPAGLSSSDQEEVAFSGPRELSAEERAAAIRPLSAEYNAKDAIDSPGPDLSGFSIFVGDAVAHREAIRTSSDTGQLQQRLSGPIYPSGSSYSGMVRVGQSSYYYFRDTITLAVLTTLSGDADLFFETCSGTPVVSSTRGGTLPDWHSVYSSTGTPDCWRVRVYGFRDSTYQLGIHSFH